MGVIVRARDFLPEKQAGMLKPIIFCVSDKAKEKEAISVNKLLAEELVKVRKNRRSVQLERCFKQVLEKLPDGVIIKDFDVLFNPDYQVDVLRIFVMVCKQKPFSILWPGRQENGKLLVPYKCNC